MANRRATRSSLLTRFSLNLSPNYPRRNHRHPPRKIPLPSSRGASVGQRAAFLSGKKRTQIAAKGGKARWGKKQQTPSRS